LKFSAFGCILPPESVNANALSVCLDTFFYSKVTLT